MSKSEYSLLNGMNDEKEKKNAFEKNLANVPVQEKKSNSNEYVEKREAPLNDEKMKNLFNSCYENGENERKERTDKNERNERKDKGFGSNMEEEQKESKKESVRNTKERLVITEFEKKIKKVIFKHKKNAQNYQRKVSKIVIKKFEHEVNVSEDKQELKSTKLS